VTKWLRPSKMAMGRLPIAKNVDAINFTRFGADLVFAASEPE